MVPDCSGNLILFHQGQVCFLLFFHFALFIQLYLQTGAWSKIAFPSRGFGTREGVFFLTRGDSCTTLIFQISSFQFLSHQDHFFDFMQFSINLKFIQIDTILLSFAEFIFSIPLNSFVRSNTGIQNFH